MTTRPLTRKIAVSASAALLLGSLSLSPAAHAADPVAPETIETITVPGNHNAEMGCDGDWDVSCTAAELTKRADGVWDGTFDLPAGSYDFKVAINSSWDENYGAGGAPGGGNISYTTEGGPVSFYYDPITHYATNTAQGPILTAAGSFQSELGCEADWSPDCLVSLLEDSDGDGVFTFTTADIPPGDYEFKVAHDQTWDVNYGADGEAGGANVGFTAIEGKIITISYELATHLITVETGVPTVPGQNDERAHWISEDTLAWPAALVPAGVEPNAATWALHSSQDADLKLTEDGVAGGETVALEHDAAGLTAEQTSLYPALDGYLALHPTGVDRAEVEGLLTGQLLVSQVTDGAVSALTGVQIPGVLDDLYGTAATDRTLGATWSKGVPSLALWAPTAQNVDVLLDTDGDPTRVAAERQNDGSWTVEGSKGWAGVGYRYEVQVYAPTTRKIVTNLVTDPYSVALTTNSTRSVLVDLDDPRFRPEAWSNTPAPIIADPVDRAIYELHVRDFSVNDPSIPAKQRGTYEAFASDGAGTTHLRELAAAGLNTVHLLPTFDLASIEEDRAKQLTPDCDLSSFAADSEEQQACVSAIADRDGYNWGYDPLHYMAPEGSYAVDPEGGARVSEFRDMVGGLHSDGLQVVLDVVFNHTNAAGQSDKSILDRVVPGYYQRLDAVGNVQTSSCCQNVATEHRLAEKLMVDSLVLWARDYHVDGFRFDLMGHSSKANLLAARAALDELTLEKDGVDGKSIYLYGEGWNFGEVADNALFEQATQGQLGGTGIGTFNDRLRDGVRGGTPTRADSTFEQGFGSGLSTDPNGDAINGTEEEQAALLAQETDWVKLGLAGNLSAFEFATADGTVKRGDEIIYADKPAGYADQPDEVVNYVDSHDDHTIYDVLAIKLPQGTPMADRVRMNTLSLATATLSQSPSLWHAGADLLRSKSLDDNSYDSGDWFNQIDFSGASSGFGAGLPRASDNGENWDAYAPILANPAIKPDSADIAVASAQAQVLLQLKQSTKLFRLGDAKLIEQKLSFPPTAATDDGVIVMSIDDTIGDDVDPALKGALVVFNASPNAITETVPALAGRDYRLSDIQQKGSDKVVKATTWDAATAAVTVPGRSVAVLTSPQKSMPQEPIDVVAAITGKLKGGKVVLTASATNTGTETVALRIVTPFGAVKVTSLKPGATKNVSINTRLSRVPAFSLKVKATTANGESETFRVRYAGSR